MTTAFDPVDLGGKRLPNRIAMSPMTRSRAYGPGATVTDLTATSGLVEDAQNYLLVWYNHRRKHTGWDVRIDGRLVGGRVTQLDGNVSHPGPNAQLARVLHRDELTAYAVATRGSWQYLFTADVGRHVRIDDPVIRARYRYGLGVRIDGGTLAVERFSVRRR